MKFRGIPWNIMKFHEISWKFHRIPWNCMKFGEIPHNFMKSCETPWISMKYHEIANIFVIFVFLLFFRAKPREAARGRARPREAARGRASPFAPARAKAQWQSACRRADICSQRGLCGRRFSAQRKPVVTFFQFSMIRAPCCHFLRYYVWFPHM